LYQSIFVLIIDNIFCITLSTSSLYISTLDQIFDFKPNEDGDYDISAVAELIVSEFLLQQENNVRLMSNNNSSNINNDTNNKLEFALEMLQIKESISMIIWTDEKQLILCEFPLLSNRSNTSPSLEYLLSVTERQPIMISLILDIGNNDCKIDYKVSFPPSMVCSKNIDFHKNNGNINDDNYLLELFPNIEERLSINWLKRKAFLEELQRLIAVLEYDAVDFSFIMIALRMKHDKMYTLCTVEFRLSHLFPMQLPLMKLHDLQNSFDSNIDTSSIKVKTFWTPERLARELLLLSSSVISLQAFGVDILQAM
jgi:hypothetical protein